jgi:hypothetical protein
MTQYLSANAIPDTGHDGLPGGKPDELRRLLGEACRRSAEVARRPEFAEDEPIPVHPGPHDRRLGRRGPVEVIEAAQAKGKWP